MYARYNGATSVTHGVCCECVVKVLFKYFESVPVHPRRLRKDGPKVVGEESYDSVMVVL
jgi:hypothetical protein